MNKNIYIIPTTKASRLFYNVGGALLYAFYNNYNGVHISITSDEKIKEGDWFINLITKEILKCFKNSAIKSLGGKTINNNEKWLDNNECKKIILTTDSELIEDNVQAIDDDFLQWFVQNSDCEYVEVIKLRKSSGFYDENQVWHWDFLGYKILIPTEQESNFFDGVHLKHCYQGEYEDNCKYGEDETCPARPKCFDCKGNIEDGICFCNKENESNTTVPATYTEQEVLDLLKRRSFDLKHKRCTKTTKEWFQQFKK